MCICVLVLPYFHLWHLRTSFLTSLNQLVFGNIAHDGYYCHFNISCICVYTISVYLYYCISPMTTQNPISNILVPNGFQKYNTWSVFLLSFSHKTWMSKRPGCPGTWMSWDLDVRDLSVRNLYVRDLDVREPVDLWDGTVLWVNLRLASRCGAQRGGGQIQQQSKSV